jgi:hypothetical protein
MIGGGNPGIVAAVTPDPCALLGAIGQLLAVGVQDPINSVLGDITTAAMREAFSQYAETHEAASIQWCWSTCNVLCTSRHLGADPR